MLLPPSSPHQVGWPYSILPLERLGASEMDTLLLPSLRGVPATLGLIEVVASQLDEVSMSSTRMGSEKVEVGVASCCCGRGWAELTGWKTTLPGGAGCRDTGVRGVVVRGVGVKGVGATGE